MSTLYNIREIKLSGKSLKTVHVAPVSQDVWRDPVNTERDNWKADDIVTMNVLKNLSVSDKSVEFQWPDMVQNGTYYFDSENIAKDPAKTYYRETYYNGVIYKTGDTYTFMSEDKVPVGDIADRFVSSDKSLKVHTTGEFLLCDVATNLQSADGYDVVNSALTVSNEGTISSIVVSDSYRLQTTETSIMMSGESITAGTQLITRDLEVSEFELIYTDSSFNEDIEVRVFEGEALQTIVTMYDSGVHFAKKTVAAGSATVNLAYILTDAKEIHAFYTVSSVDKDATVTYVPASSVVGSEHPAYFKVAYTA